MKNKIIFYKDLKNNTKKQEKLKELFNLKEDESYSFINMYSEEASLKYKAPLVYLMGEFDDSQLPWIDAEIIGKGPSYSELNNKEAREKLINEVRVGSPGNLFDKHLALSVNYVDAKALLKEAPPLKLCPVPRAQNIPDLEGNIDDAISAIQFLKDENVPIALPELNVFISSDATTNSLSYKELLALLLVFKRFGAENLYWKDKVVFSNE